MVKPKIPDYEIKSICGSGAYGDVWLCMDRNGILRAVKTLDKERLKRMGILQREENALQLFRTQAPKHRNLVEIFHTGETETVIYYVMELADNIGSDAEYIPDTLENRIKNKIYYNEECILLMSELLDAVQALHDAGLAHRDIKPSNIIFADNVPKLADIGLVMPTNIAMRDVGTMHFMPDDSTTGNDADIFSMGKILYCVFTGQPVENFPMLPEKFLSAKLKVIMRLNKVAIKACSKIPENRFKSASQFKSAMKGDSVSLKDKASQTKWLLLLLSLTIAVLACFCYSFSGIIFKQAETEIPSASESEMEKEIQMLSDCMICEEWQRAIDVTALIKAKYPQADHANLDKIAERARLEIATALAQSEAEKAKLELEKIKREAEKVKFETTKMLDEREKDQVNLLGKAKENAGTGNDKEVITPNQNIVKVEGAYFVLLQKDEEIWKGSAQAWREGIDFLKGKLFSKYFDIQGGMARVKILDDGWVYMAITDMAEDSNDKSLNGYMSRAQILGLGWRWMGVVSSTSLDWNIYGKNCKKGSVFNYRTGKTIPPIIIVGTEKPKSDTVKANTSNEPAINRISNKDSKAPVDKKDMQGEFNATVNVICADLFTFCVNGKQIDFSDDRDHPVFFTTEANIKRGDVITVKCSSTNKDYGFACQIEFKDGRKIATSKKDWKSFFPTNNQSWTNPNLKIVIKRTVIGGTNKEWEDYFHKEPDIQCESIWGGRDPSIGITSSKPKPANPAYLVYEVK